MFGVSTEDIIGVIKKIIGKIASWLWEKFKDWLSKNWQKALILILSLIVIVLLKILFAGLSFSSFQRILALPDTSLS